MSFWRAGLAGLLWCNGVTAVGGGVALVAGLIQPGLELIADSPFDSYLLPGLLLAMVGGVHAAAAWLLHRRHALAWFWSGLAGGAMIVFELVEYAIIGYHWLQVLYIATGAAIGVLALGIRRR